MKSLPKIRFTHCGLHCIDLDGMVDFYTRKIGFVVSDKGIASTGHRLFFMTQDPEIHHQFVLFDGKPDKLEFNLVNQVSFLLDSLDDLKDFYQFIQQQWDSKFEQVDHGNAWSLYFMDPEGNPIEMYVDTPFYTHQPCREPLDLNMSTADILAQTEAMCHSRPDFMTREQWIEATRKLIEEKRVRW